VSISTTAEQRGLNTEYCMRSVTDDTFFVTNVLIVSTGQIDKQETLRVEVFAISTLKQFLLQMHITKCFFPRTFELS
jgi:hypothetical protein